ncbi:MAG TPA: hypothetical protein VG860_09345 [Terriglobia bacterium]|jgi:hypothetical protein|nr:hypothetical protein [Terriglobia bacterium]
MKFTLFNKLCLTLALLAASAGGWAQAPDSTQPAGPPPDGRFAFVHGRPMFEGVRPVTGAPFSAQASTQTTQVLADGNQINHTETATVSRDSAGRTRHDGTISNIGPWASAGTPRELVRIVDPVAGASYMLDVTAKTAMTMPLHQGKHGMPAGVPRQKTDGNSTIQRATESLGTQVMAGVNAEGTRTTETIPAGTMGNQNPIVIVSERWYSPDLQETVYSKRTDPRVGTTIYQLTNITRQEPNESLFQVPADYTVKEARDFRGPKNASN